MNKKLYRSSKDKMLGGVAAGLGEYFDIDATLVRVIFVVTLFLGGTGVLAYIILWIIVPEEPIIFNKPTEESSGTETEPPKQETQFDSNTYYSALDRQRERRSKYCRIYFAGIGNTIFS